MGAAKGGGHLEGARDAPPLGRPPRAAHSLAMGGAGKGGGAPGVPRENPSAAEGRPGVVSGMARAWWSMLLGPG